MRSNDLKVFVFSLTAEHSDSVLVQQLVTLSSQFTKRLDLQKKKLTSDMKR
jgi:hypothetical protein